MIASDTPKVGELAREANQVCGSGIGVRADSNNRRSCTYIVENRETAVVPDIRCPVLPRM